MNTLPGDGWTGAGASLSEEQWEAARALVAEHGGADTFSMVLVSGSLAAGLGNALSDVDLLVAFRPGRSSALVAHDVGEHSVQFNPVPWELLTELVEIGSAFVATANERTQLRLPELTRKELVRVTIAQPLLEDPQFAALRAKLDPVAVRRLTMAFHAVPIAQHAEDCLGALRSADFMTALQASAISLRNACELALAGAGSLYVGEKFLGRRLQQSPALAHLVRPLWTALTEGPSWGSDRPAVSRCVLRRLYWAGHLAAYGLRTGWDDPMQTLPAPRLRGAGPRRSPYFVPLRFADGWALSGPDIGLRASADLVHIWTLLDGRPLPDVVDAFLAAKGATGSRQADAVRSAINALLSKGAAVGPEGGDLMDIDLDLELEEDGACSADVR